MHKIARDANRFNAGLTSHQALLALLNAEEIGITLSEEDQLDPEQSTSPIVVHHTGEITSRCETGVFAADAAFTTSLTAGKIRQNRRGEARNLPRSAPTILDLSTRYDIHRVRFADDSSGKLVAPKRRKKSALQGAGSGI
jgi:hypothetical protein